jgi:hypothetical protein
MRLLVYTLLLFLAGFGAPTYGQANANQSFIDQKKWSKEADKYNFSESYKTITPKEKKKNLNYNFSPRPWFSGISSFKGVFGLILIGILVFVLVYLLINAYRASDREISSKQISYTSAVDNIEKADLELMLDKALEEGDYKHATRIKYLMLLRTLTVLEFIHWKKDKTNWNYIVEMRNRTGADLFVKVTQGFERVWYGDKLITKDDYYRMVPVFDQINEMVRQA